MNLNVFVPLDLVKISKLSFIERTVPFLFKESQNGPLLSGVIHEISTETEEKLDKLFTGKDYKINKEDILYVFPNCKIPQFKIKEAIKQLKAQFTSDYTKATCYLGSEKSFRYMTRKEFTINLLGGTYMYIFDLCKKRNLKSDSTLDLENINYKEQFDNVSFYYVMNASSCKHFNAIESIHSLKCLMPLGADIVYNILSKKIPVISEDNFLSQLNPTCVIDNEMYVSLDNMLSSKDEENQQLALQTISNSDRELSKNYIWLLVKKHYKLFNNSRFKNVKLFNTMINLKEIYDESVKDFIIKLMNDNVNNIHVDIIKQLFDSEAETFVEDLKSNVFDIILVPKQKFKDAIPELTYKYELEDE